MARLFLLFLIALLPLRGWTAQAMVMPLQPAAAHAQLAQSAPVSDAMPADCAQHLPMAASAADADSAPRPLHKSCQSCQLCMPLAAVAAPVLPDMPFGPQAQPSSQGSRFASADAARHAKPPIF